MRPGPTLLGALAAAAAAGAIAIGAADDDSAERPVAASTPAAENSGLRVFVASGCGTCHTLAAAGSRSDAGPELATSLKGKGRAYVIESIVAPGTAAAPGFDSGLMPEGYGEKISRPDIERLADFLLDQAGS